jgi:hypothetical protein
VGLEHPLRKQAFLAVLGDDSKMGSGVIALLAKHDGALAVEGMIRIAHLKPGMMGSMLNLRLQDHTRSWPICRATRTASPSPIIACSRTMSVASLSSSKITVPSAACVTNP